MDLGLRGRGALVTGASSGLGLAAALRLAAEGVEVVINSRSEERLHKAATHILDDTGARVRIIAADLTPPGAAEMIASRAAEMLPHGVDILVSNTGGPPPGLLLDHPAERFPQTADLLLHSAINLTRAVLPAMIEKEWGRLIYITSIAAIQPVNDLILSNTYRAGLTGFCKTVANTYAKYGITANTVCPGYTATERLLDLARKRAAATGQSEQEVITAFAQDSPAGRIGKPEELAALIAFLASEHAAYINGANIPVDGGAHKSLA